MVLVYKNRRQSMTNWKEKKLTERIISKMCKYVGMILLLGLMAVIMISDVVKIFHG